MINDETPEQIAKEEADNAALSAKMQADYAAAHAKPSKPPVGARIANGIAKVAFWPFRWLIPRDVRGDD